MMRMMRRMLCTLLTLCMIAAIAPVAAHAEVTRTENIVVRAGESITVWNNDIAASGVIKNRITVKVKEDTTYDAVFPEGGGIASVLSGSNEGIDAYETSDYIKPDADGAGGMLIALYVKEGEALLLIESVTESISPMTLTAYAAEDSPLEYTTTSAGQSFDCFLPDGCNLSYISLGMFGTNGTEVMRTLDAETNSYELYSFARDALTVHVYENGQKDAAMTIPYSSLCAYGEEVFFGAVVPFPAGQAANVGTLKTKTGSTIYALPKTPERDESKEIPFDDTVGTFGTSGEYVPLSERFGGEENRILTISTSDTSVEAAKGTIPDEQVQVILDFGKNFEEKSRAGRIAPLNLNTQEIPHGTLYLFDLTKVVSYETKQIWQSEQLKESMMVKLDFLETMSSASYELYHFDGGRLAPIPLIPSAATVNDQESGGFYVPVNYHLPVNDQNNDSCLIFVRGGTSDRSAVGKNESFTLTANTPAPGMRFVRWEGSTFYLSDAAAPQTTGAATGMAKELYFNAVFEPIMYNVSANAAGGGAVLPDVSEAAAGETVGVTVVPDPGYALSSIDGVSGLAPDGNDPNRYVFTMPDGDAALNALFAKAPLAVHTSAQNGTLLSDKQTATIGEPVTLTLTPQSASFTPGTLSVRAGGTEIETTKVNDNTYTFIMPASDVTVEAIFVEKFIVTFVNLDGEILQWNDLAAGETPVYTGRAPTVDPSDTHHFVFSGWDREIAAVTENVTYTATYTVEPRSYTVTFLGDNGEVLQSGGVLYGETPVYAGQTPAKAADNEHIYSFAAFEPYIVPVTGDAVYNAVFRAVPVLQTGRNILELYEYETVVCPFTPTEDGYYRFWTTGKKVSPECHITDGAGNERITRSFYYTVDDNDLNHNEEFIAELEAGVTYDLSVQTGGTSGSMNLYIEHVTMHTVHNDRTLEHGAVNAYDEDAFTLYTGERFIPDAVPDPGYGLIDLIVTDENGRRLMGDEGAYVMPDCDVYVTAVFTPAYTIGFDVNYGVTYTANTAVTDDWSEEILVQRAAGGAGVELRFEWDAEYLLEEFSVKTANGEEVPCGGSSRYSNRMDIWFTMPNEEIVVTAKVKETRDLNFDPGEGDGVKIGYSVKENTSVVLPECVYTAPEGKVFAGWSVAAGEGSAVLMQPGDEITMSENAAATAAFIMRPFYDLNKDALVSILDVTELLDVLSGAGRAELTICDLDGDNDVSIADVTTLLDVLAGN